MAGYIGSKAVNLSTTGADIAGDADVSGALDVGGAFTSQGIDDNATSTAMTLDASGNVGIGVTPEPSWDTFTALQIEGSSLGSLGDNNTILGSNIYHDNNAFKYIGSAAATVYQQRLGEHRWSGAASGTADNTASMTQHMTLDASGNLLVGKTAADVTVVGVELLADGKINARHADGQALDVRREGTSGNIAIFRSGNSGFIRLGESGNAGYIDGVSGDTGLKFEGAHIRPRDNGADVDNAVDLGNSSYRFDDIYVLSVISTSDRNEKQDIAELSDAEQRVAVAAKGLMRKFRWKNRVAEKGDDARIHCGIIAQDLQAAFAAEGLDAGRYAMFISTTWWETQTEVSAVEAVAEVLDEEGNVVTEAVEAVDAYTRTDTYDTQEEAPEGATERTRLGVRYSELLAFIIGAL